MGVSKSFICPGLSCLFAYKETMSRKQRNLLQVKVKMKVTQSCSTLCDPMDYTVHGILQARMLEWVAYPFSSISSQPRNGIGFSRIAGGFFTDWGQTVSKFYINVLYLVASHFYVRVMVAQRLKRLPAMQETWVQSLSREDPLEKEMATTPVFLPGESHGRRSPMSVVWIKFDWIKDGIKEYIFELNI